MFGSLSLTASESRLDGSSDNDSEAASITTMLENLSLEEPEIDDEGLLADEEGMTDGYSEDGTDQYPGSSASSWGSSEGHESFLDYHSDEQPEVCNELDPGVYPES